MSAVCGSLGLEVMTVAQDELRRRPERVIILDADDPMREIEGGFVWQDEHERVVDETRRAAFAEGYAAGLRQLPSAAAPTSLHVEIRRRRGWVSRLTFVVLILGLVALIIALPVVVFGS